MSVARANDNLVLRLSNGRDSISVQGFFYLDSAGNSKYQIDRIDFADGTQWDVSTIRQMVLQTTDGADQLIGYASGDVIDGGLGDDRIEGLAGDDTLIGNLGNDSLSGGAGNDLLHGGSGNDSLDGGEGS
ncbi:hypothetical protein DOQ73_24965, partial [Salmonella enterica subsp. enterica]|nr:hypothetical protein [Salmonella enterica subsp. enterica serovar Javiana]